MKRPSVRRLGVIQAFGGPLGSTGVMRLLAALLLVASLCSGAAGRSDADVPSVDMHADGDRSHRGDLYDQPQMVGERIQALIPDADRNCLNIAEWKRGRFQVETQTATQVGLSAAVRQIQESETGSWLVQVAADLNVVACLDHATMLEAHYRAHLRLLGLSARLSPASQVVFLAHELAHVPQHPRFSNNRRFSPEDMILLQRVREAAAEAVATRVLWQLRAKGITAPWQTKLTTAYRDIAETFEGAMAEGEGLTQELRATRSAFHRWFAADWRRQIYDDLMLKTLTRIAADETGLIPTTRYLSDRYLLGIGNYAGQDFLISGDGLAIIRDFHTSGLAVGDQLRLDVILAKKRIIPAHNLTSPNRKALSMISPPAMINPPDALETGAAPNETVGFNP